MPFWGWLIIIVVCIIASSVITWLLLNRPTNVDLTFEDELKDSLKKQLDIEKKSKEELQKFADALEQQIKVLNDKHNENIFNIEKELDDEKNKLTDDDSYLNYRISDILDSED